MNCQVICLYHKGKPWGCIAWLDVCTNWSLWMQAIMLTFWVNTKETLRLFNLSNIDSSMLSVDLKEQCPSPLLKHIPTEDLEFSGFTLYLRHQTNTQLYSMQQWWRRRRQGVTPSSLLAFQTNAAELMNTVKQSFKNMGTDSHIQLVDCKKKKLLVYSESHRCIK